MLALTFTSFDGVDPAPQRLQGRAVLECVDGERGGPPAEALAARRLARIRLGAGRAGIRQPVQRRGSARGPRVPLLVVRRRGRAVRDHARDPAPHRPQAPSARRLRAAPAGVVATRARLRVARARRDLRGRLRLRPAFRNRSDRRAGTRAERVGPGSRRRLRGLLRRRVGRRTDRRRAHLSRARVLASAPVRRLGRNPRDRHLVRRGAWSRRGIACPDRLRPRRRVAARPHGERLPVHDPARVLQRPRADRLRRERR